MGCLDGWVFQGGYVHVYLHGQMCIPTTSHNHTPIPILYKYVPPPPPHSISAKTNMRNSYSALKMTSMSST